MSGWIDLRAADGHRLACWQAVPAGEPRGGGVVVQEIFGVNAHIQALGERYAAEGWLALAPALFDRVQRDVAFAYEPADVAQARDLKAKVDEREALLDVAAAAAWAHREAARVAVIGFCWGGTLAWRTAAREGVVDAAVAYYGTQIAQHLDEAPRCPVLLHFGRHDTHIPMRDVERIGRAHPRAQLHVYETGHGFNCDARGAWHADSAQRAGERTRAFLADTLMASRPRA